MTTEDHLLTRPWSISNLYNDLEIEYLRYQTFPLFVLNCVTHPFKFSASCVTGSSQRLASAAPSRGLIPLG